MILDDFIMIWALTEKKKIYTSNWIVAIQKINFTAHNSVNTYTIGIQHYRKSISVEIMKYVLSN